jgi:uncharacterized membrane protein
MVWLVIAAGLAAVAQAFFAYRELHDWGVPFVLKVAKGWAVPDPKQFAAHVDWARPLAINMGSYNLLLALALAWTALAASQQWPSAVPLAVVLGLFLLGAAAAAGKTKVYLALYAQGTLGVLLLAAAWWQSASGQVGAL